MPQLDVGWLSIAPLLFAACLEKGALEIVSSPMFLRARKSLGLPFGVAHSYTSITRFGLFLVSKGKIILLPSANSASAAVGLIAMKYLSHSPFFTSILPACIAFSTGE